MSKMMNRKSKLTLWENKEIRFDIPNLQHKLRNGELVLDTVYHIEDTKGNPGDSGRLLATNLRLIWHSLTHKKFNLSIGYGCVLNIKSQEVFGKVRGTRQALSVMALGNNTRFEFLFTDVSGETVRRHAPIYNGIIEIYQRHQRTFLYRELKLRGAIIQSGQLIIMPQEQVYSTVQGVWNLSSDQGNLGAFALTNIRFVWFADSNEMFNISLPYLQIATVRIRESKYGPALVVQTSDSSGGYVLGFRIDPPERLNEIYKELVSLHTIFSETPNFGVIYDPRTQAGQPQQPQNPNDDSFKFDDFQEIDDRQEREINTKLNAYITSGSIQSGNYAEKPREPVYCKELGFAMERIRDGYKLKDLWDVMPTKMSDFE